MAQVLDSRTARLTIFGIVGVLIGVGVGSWLLRSSSTIPEPSPPSVGEEVAREDPQGESLSGKVLPLGPSIYMQGTHKLIDENGEMIAVLKVYDDKLKLAEGHQVEVFGKMTKTVEGDMTLMEVERIKFK